MSQKPYHAISLKMLTFQSTLQSKIRRKKERKGKATQRKEKKWKEKTTISRHFLSNNKTLVFRYMEGKGESDEHINK